MPTSWSMRFCNRAGNRHLFQLLLIAGLALAPAAWPVILAGGLVVHPSIRAATEAAAADQSQVLVLFTANASEAGNELREKTLSSKEFGEQSGPLHMVEIDVETEQDIARAYGVTTVPTLVLMTPESK